MLSRREQVWLAAYIAAYRRGFPNNDSAKQAEYCLMDFDSKFPEEKPKPKCPMCDNKGFVYGLKNLSTYSVCPNCDTFSEKTGIKGPMV